LFPLFAIGVVDTSGKFDTGAVDTNSALDLRKYPPIFKKIRNDPRVISRGLGEDDSRKNLKLKIS
jgi:hypothetical protein